jgi:hypothetical protein
LYWPPFRVSTSDFAVHILLKLPCRFWEP